MITFALDANHDWTLLLKKDLYCVEQSLKTRLWQIQNDCQFELDAGIPFEFFDRGNIERLKAKIENIINSTNGVVNSKTTFIEDTNNRKLKIQSRVKTEFSQDIILSTGFTI